MQDSELLFNTISAIAIGLVLSIAPGAARAACDDLRSSHPHGLYIGAGRRSIGRGHKLRLASRASPAI